MPSRPTFLYDADCGPCSTLKAAASFLDPSRRVDFLPIHEAAQSGLLATVHESEWYSCSRLLLPDGTYSEGGDAMVGLLSFFPGGRIPSAMVSKLPMGLPAARALYGIVSRLHSYSCSTPSSTSRIPTHTKAWTIP